MNKNKVSTIFTIILTISFKILSAQNITFSPLSDTIKIIDASTSPEIICSVNPGILYDTILISPGFNTYFEYIDTLNQWQSTETCQFLIKDSSNQYDYELWYIPLGTLPYFQQVPFDTFFYSYDYIFELKLLVKSQETHIDSSFQLFKTEYGLGTDL